MYASKAFLKHQGAPKSLEEISDFPIVVYGETAGPEIKEINWLLEHYRKHFLPGLRKRLQSLRVNNITGILKAVEAGLGIGVLPDYVAVSNPELVRVLPDVTAPSFDVHLVYADALRQSKRVAAFRDFLVKGSKRLGSTRCRTSLVGGRTRGIGEPPLHQFRHALEIFAQRRIVGGFAHVGEDRLVALPGGDDEGAQGLFPLQGEINHSRPPPKCPAIPFPAQTG